MHLKGVLGGSIQSSMVIGDFRFEKVSYNNRTSLVENQSHPNMTLWIRKSVKLSFCVKTTTFFKVSSCEIDLCFSELCHS
jgi:hypothetical protein